MKRSLGRFGRTVILVGVVIFAVSLLSCGTGNQNWGIVRLAARGVAWECGEHPVSLGDPPLWIQDTNISVEELLVRKYSAPKEGSRCWTIDSALRNANELQLSLSRVLRDEADGATLDALFSIHKATDSAPGLEMGNSSSRYGFVTTSRKQCISMCLFEMIRGVESGEGCTIAVFHPQRSMCYLSNSDFKPSPADPEVVTAVLSPSVIKPVESCLRNPTPIVPLSTNFPVVEPSHDSTSPHLLALSGASDEACLERCSILPQCATVVRNGSMCYLQGPTTAAVKDEPCRASATAPLVPHSIVFGVLAGGIHIQQRLVPALKTWLFDVPSVSYVETEYVDEARAAIAPLMARGVKAFVVPLDAVQNRPPSDRFQGVGAWKNFPIARHLIYTMKNYSWYAIVDDDSFIYQQNLQILLNSYVQHPTIPRYLGAVFGWEGADFIQGGAGILFNNAASHELLRLLLNGVCQRECTQWAGDIQLGCCFGLAKPRPIIPIDHRGFTSQSPFTTVGRDYRQNESDYPVSFHQMRNVTWIYDTFRLGQRFLWPSAESFDQSIFDGENGCMQWNSTANGPCTWRPGGEAIKWAGVVRVLNEEWRGSRYAEGEYTKPE